jgi:hypothetical protein
MSPHVFTTYERYLDRAAMDRHNNSAAVARFFDIAKPMIDGEVTLVTGTELSAKANDQVMMNLSGRARHAPVCGDLCRHLLDRFALLHGGSPDEGKSGGFGDGVRMHHLKDGGEHDPTRAKAFFQLDDLLPQLVGALDPFERHDERRVDAGGTERFDEKRRWIKLQHKLQPARRFRAQQGDDWASFRQSAPRGRGERQQFIVDQHHVWMAFEGATGLPCEDVDSQAFELPPDDRQVTLILDSDERPASAEGK